MFARVLTIALGALVLWALWSVLRPRPVFVVRIIRGTPRVARGTVTPAFVQEVAEVCTRHRVRDAAVQGVMQLNLLLPAGVPTGSAVPVKVTVGTATSKANVTIAIH